MWVVEKKRESWIEKSLTWELNILKEILSTRKVAVLESHLFHQNTKETSPSFLCSIFLRESFIFHYVL